MKKRWIIVFALVFFALALLALAPASLIDARLRAASGESLRLDDAAGTLWRGRGRLVAALPEGPLVLVERLFWEIEWSALLHARLAFRLSADADQTAHLALGVDTITLSSLRLRLPAAVLALSPKLAASRPAGEIALEVPQLEWRNAESRGQGQVIWEHARLALPGGGLRDLGRLVFELKAEGDHLSLESAKGSPVALHFELSRRAGQGIEWQRGLNP